MSSHSAVCVSEGGRVKAGLQIRAASVVIIRCCRKSQRLPLRPVALSLSTPPVFLSVVRCLSLSFKNTPSLALSIHLLCPHRQASFSFEDTHVFFNPSHQITDSPWRNCKCKAAIDKIWLKERSSLWHFYAKVTEINSIHIPGVRTKTFLILDVVLSCITVCSGRRLIMTRAWNLWLEYSFLSESNWSLKI